MPLAAQKLSSGQLAYIRRSKWRRAGQLSQYFFSAALKVLKFARGQEVANGYVEISL
jgi:hypothetical protein